MCKRVMDKKNKVIDYGITNKKNIAIIKVMHINHNKMYVTFKVERNEGGN